MSFFVLAKPTTDSPEDVAGGIDITQAEGTQTGDFPKCPNCNYPLGMREWLPPYRVELETWGRVYGDVATVSDGLVLSEGFMVSFVRANLTGLSHFQPVEVVKVIFRRRKIKDSPPLYLKATISHSSTTVDQEASGYVWGDKSKVCPICLRGGTVKRYAKVVIDENSWNGDDIFWPRGGPCILVSGRFKKLCEQEGVRGVIFKKPEEESCDLFPWETEARTMG